jgi:hypothetical protein
VLGFFGLFYWLRRQDTFNKKAESEANKLK